MKQTTQFLLKGEGLALTIAAGMKRNQVQKFTFKYRSKERKTKKTFRKKYISANNKHK